MMAEPQCTLVVGSRHTFPWSHPVRRPGWNGRVKEGGPDLGVKMNNGTARRTAVLDENRQLISSDDTLRSARQRES